MPKLIDADKLKAHYAWWDNEDKKIFDTIVDLQPIVDAEPVRHGRWEFTDDAMFGNPFGSYKCSECGNTEPHKTKYCSNCGCKMGVDINGTD